MPYNYDPNLDDEEKKNATGGAETTQLAGGSQVAGGASDTAPQDTSNPKGTTSDSYQNLNDYLKANEGNGFGGDFAGKVQGEVDNAYNAQNDAANQFKGQSDQSTVKYNDDLVNDAATNATDFVNDADKLKAFTAQRDANYTGPTAYTDSQDAYQKAAGATQKAQDYTNASQSEGGRFALLDNYFGKPEYNQGQKSLDNLLISGDQNAQQGLEQARQNASGAQQAFQGQGAQLADYAASNRATTEATKKAVADKFTGDNGVIPQYQQTLTDQYNKALADQQAQYSQLTTGIGSGTKGTQNLTDAQLALMGLGKGDSLYNVDPGKYASLGETPTLSGVTSGDQLARLKALDQLMGQDQTFIGDEGSVGSYDPSKSVNFDAAGFNAARGQVAGQYQNALNGTAQSFGVNNRTQSGKLSDEIAYYNNVVKPEIAQGAVGGTQLQADKSYEAQIQAALAKLSSLYGVDNTVNQQAGYAQTGPVGGVRRIPT